MLNYQSFILFLVLLAPIFSLNQTQQPKTILTYQYLIFEQNCTQAYKLNGLSSIQPKCLAYTISQIFNLILLPICLILRVPQILIIIQNKSVYGLTYFGNNLQLLMTALTLAYGLHSNFSFWIYGENILLSIQNLIIVYLFFHYPQGKTPKQKSTDQLRKLPGFVITLIVSTVFVLQLVPDWCQQLSIWLQLLVFIGARGSQILNNYLYKTSKNVSLKTIMTTLFANFARTFTILVEQPGSIGYLLNYLFPIFVNGTLAIQSYYYRNLAQKQDNQALKKDKNK